jgi:hypothetical protein
MSTAIRPKDRDAVIQSLRAGVVPRVGQHLIQVGRVKEVEALLKDIERVADSGSGIRFVIGEYGSGKTFFLNLIRAIALEKRLVTAHADLTPDRRLHSTGGQTRSLYAELMRNISTRSKPEGGAMQSIVERFVTEALKHAKAKGVDPEVIIHEQLNVLSEMVGGYDFALVIAAYWKGHDTGNEQLKSDAIRWLRAEFSTKTEARTALGVRNIIDDLSFYDHLKLMARFVRLAGFEGMLICLDELVNLYKLSNVQARNSNYEQILRILNDSLQGTAVGLGFILGGTPDFLMDTRRGLYSYSALQSRLAENTFAVKGLVDYSGPVLRLSNLSPEDFFILLGKIRHVFAYGNSTDYLLPDDALKSFMEHCSKKIGDAYFRTPRNTITSFVNFLSVLEQNRQATWQGILGTIEVKPDINPDLDTPLGDSATEATIPAATVSRPDDGEESLATFKL